VSLAIEQSDSSTVFISTSFQSRGLLGGELQPKASVSFMSHFLNLAYDFNWFPYTPEFHSPRYWGWG
jgi:hypothetical protein